MINSHSKNHDPGATSRPPHRRCPEGPAPGRGASGSAVMASWRSWLLLSIACRMSSIWYPFTLCREKRRYRLLLGHTGREHIVAQRHEGESPRPYQRAPSQLSPHGYGPRGRSASAQQRKHFLNRFPFFCSAGLSSPPLVVHPTDGDGEPAAARSPLEPNSYRRSIEVRAFITQT